MSKEVLDLILEARLAVGRQVGHEGLLLVLSPEAWAEVQRADWSKYHTMPVTLGRMNEPEVLGMAVEVDERLVPGTWRVMRRIEREEGRHD
jgi:hypothetical protein